MKPFSTTPLWVVTSWELGGMRRDPTVILSTASFVLLLAISTGVQSSIVERHRIAERDAQALLDERWSIARGKIESAGKSSEDNQRMRTQWWRQASYVKRHLEPFQIHPIPPMAALCGVSPGAPEGIAMRSRRVVEPHMVAESAIHGSFSPQQLLAILIPFLAVSVVAPWVGAERQSGRLAMMAVHPGLDSLMAGKLLAACLWISAAAACGCLAAILTGQVDLSDTRAVTVVVEWTFAAILYSITNVLLVAGGTASAPDRGVAYIQGGAVAIGIALFVPGVVSTACRARHPTPARVSQAIAVRRDRNASIIEAWDPNRRANYDEQMKTRLLQEFPELAGLDGADDRKLRNAGRGMHWAWILQDQDHHVAELAEQQHRLRASLEWTSPTLVFQRFGNLIFSNGYYRIREFEQQHSQNEHNFYSVFLRKSVLEEGEPIDYPPSVAFLPSDFAQLPKFVFAEPALPTITQQSVYLGALILWGMMAGGLVLWKARRMSFR